MKKSFEKLSKYISWLLRSILVVLFVMRIEHVDYFVKAQKYTKRIDVINFWNPLTYVCFLLYAILFSAAVCVGTFFKSIIEVLVHTIKYGKSQNKLYRQLKSTLQQSK